MSDEYVGYKTPSTIVSETVYHFLRGGMYGAAFGLVRKESYNIRSIPICCFVAHYLHFFLLLLLLLCAFMTFLWKQVTPFHAPGSAGAIKGTI